MVFLPFLTKSRIYRELFTETRYAFSTKERNSNSNKKDKTFVHIICQTASSLKSCSPACYLRFVLHGFQSKRETARSLIICPLNRPFALPSEFALRLRKLLLPTLAVVQSPRRLRAGQRSFRLRVFSPKASWLTFDALREREIKYIAFSFPRVTRFKNEKQYIIHLLSAFKTLADKNKNKIYRRRNDRFPLADIVISSSAF